MESDYDIYADLSTTDVTTFEEIEKLRQQNTHLQELIHSLEADIEKLCARISEMKKTQDNLAKNISELFKTAKAEIERKDRTINELRSQVEALQMEKRNRGMGIKRERSVSSHRSSGDSISKKVKYEDYVKRQRRSPSSHRRSRSRSREKYKHSCKEQSKTHDRMKDRKPILSTVQVTNKPIKVESKIVDGTQKKVKKIEDSKYTTKDLVEVNYKEHKFVTSLKEADNANGFQAKVLPVSMKLNKSDCKNNKNVETVCENSKTMPRNSIEEKVATPVTELEKNVKEVNKKVPYNKKQLTEENSGRQSENKIVSDKNRKEKQQPPVEKNNGKQSENKVSDQKKSSGNFEEKKQLENTVPNEKISHTKENQQPPCEKNEPPGNKVSNEKNSNAFEEKKQPPSESSNEKKSENNVSDEKNSYTFDEKKSPPSEKNEKLSGDKVSDEKSSDTFDEKKQSPPENNIEKQSENQVGEEKNSYIFVDNPSEKNEKQSKNKVGDEKNSCTFDEIKQLPPIKNEKQSGNKVGGEKNSDTFKEEKQPPFEKSGKESGNKVDDEKQPPLETNRKENDEKQLVHAVVEKKQTEKKKTRNKLKIEDVTTKLKQRLNESSEQLDKKIIESKEKKNYEQVKQPEITENKKPKKVKETKVKKDKCDEEIPESGRILRSATRRNSSREKLDIKKLETSPIVVLNDLECANRMSLTHEGEIPTLHISDSENSICGNQSLFDLNSSHTVTSSPLTTKTVDMQLLKEDLNISLDQSPIESFVSSKSDSAISPNTSSARKRRRYLVTLI